MPPFPPAGPPPSTTLPISAATTPRPEGPLPAKVAAVLARSEFAELRRLPAPQLRRMFGRWDGQGASEAGLPVTRLEWLKSHGFAGHFPNEPASGDFWPTGGFWSPIYPKQTHQSPREGSAPPYSNCPVGKLKTGCINFHGFCQLLLSQWLCQCSSATSAILRIWSTWQLFPFILFNIPMDAKWE